MSDPRAIPEEERPFIPDELVPRQEGDDDPMRADRTRQADSGEGADDADDESIDVEDLP